VVAFALGFSSEPVRRSRCSAFDTRLNASVAAWIDFSTFDEVRKREHAGSRRDGCALRALGAWGSALRTYSTAQTVFMSVWNHSKAHCANLIASWRALRLQHAGCSQTCRFEGVYATAWPHQS
jgi:hypothetical protein